MSSDGFFVEEVFVDLIQGEDLPLLDGHTVFEHVARQVFAVNQNDAAMAIAGGAFSAAGRKV